ncbi:MAG: hypothetical protein ACE5JO_08590 [Candidatus Binatia bacterium]
MVGAKAGDLINPRYLKFASGILFIGIGLFTLLK